MGVPKTMAVIMTKMASSLAWLGMLPKCEWGTKVEDTGEMDWKIALEWFGEINHSEATI